MRNHQDTYAKVLPEIGQEIENLGLGNPSLPPLTDGPVGDACDRTDILLSEPVTPKRPHYLRRFDRPFEVLHSDTDVENVSEFLRSCFRFAFRIRRELPFGFPARHSRPLHDHDAPVVRYPARTKSGSAQGSRSLLS